MKGKHHSEETKLKIKNSVRKVFAIRPEIKEKLKNTPRHKWTVEERKQISERQKGKKLTEEHKRKISEKK